TEAIERYEQGAKRCDLLGLVAAPQSCGLRLNMALLYKAQGEMDNALRECQEARVAFQRFARPDSPGLAAFDAARASMLATKLDREKANPRAPRVLGVCEEHTPPEKSLLQTPARHGQALYRLHRGDPAGAEKVWQEVRERQGKGSPLLPRTLNYLAITRECGA